MVLWCLLLCRSVFILYIPIWTTLRWWTPSHCHRQWSSSTWPPTVYCWSPRIVFCACSLLRWSNLMCMWITTKVKGVVIEEVKVFCILLSLGNWLKSALQVFEIHKQVRSCYCTYCLKLAFTLQFDLSSNFCAVHVGFIDRRLLY